MDSWEFVTKQEAKKAKQNHNDKKETRSLSRAMMDGALIIDNEGIARVSTLGNKVSQFLSVTQQIGKLKEIGRFFEVLEGEVSKKSPYSYELEDLKSRVNK